MKRICIDAGFLIALYWADDEHHERAEECFVAYLDESHNKLVVPWPILYETFATKMVKKPHQVEALNKDWKQLKSQDRLDLIDDSEFREEAVSDCFLEAAEKRKNYRALSLADRVVRSIINDPNSKVDVFITFNPGDFADVCKIARCEMIN